MRLLSAHDWPGNGREVRNVVHRAVILCPEGEIEPRHLPEALRGPRARTRPSDGATAGVHVPIGTTIDQAEKALILATLHRYEAEKKDGSG